MAVTIGFFIVVPEALEIAPGLIDLYAKGFNAVADREAAEVLNWYGLDLSKIDRGGLSKRDVAAMATRFMDLKRDLLGEIPDNFPIADPEFGNGTFFSQIMESVQQALDLVEEGSENGTANNFANQDNAGSDGYQSNYSTSDEEVVDETSDEVSDDSAPKEHTVGDSTFEPLRLVQAAQAGDVDTSKFFLNFGSTYDKIALDDREACILGRNVIGRYECRVAGTAIIIQGNGKALAVPLPNLYRAWD